MLRHLLLASLFSWPLLSFAQMHHPVLPGLEGSTLLQALQDGYRPSSLLSYGDARDTLYRNIDARNDTLYGVYTGFAVYLPPGEDPTTAAFQNGAGLNTEHTYPRGKGADGQIPEADLHHLFPARVLVNAARGNFPFADIPPSQVNSWYYLDQSQSNTPSSNLGAYSRVGGQVFEPRDSHKGDVARAMFYFYTMYQPEADAADPEYFEQQRVTLCQWHYSDPVSEREWVRTHQIAAYQEGKANPFVLDCTVADRCYCEDVIPPCTPPVSTHDEATTPWQARIFPQPAQSQATLAVTLPEPGRLSMAVYNAQGRLATAPSAQSYPEGAHQIPLQLPRAAGLYFCQLEWAGYSRYRRKTLKFIVR